MNETPTGNFITTCIMYIFIVLVWTFQKIFYLPVLANSSISELFLKAINCKVGVTLVLEEALAFIPQSNGVRKKCSRLWGKELERYFLWFYGSNINLRVFRILKERDFININWGMCKTVRYRAYKIKEIFALYKCPIISTCHCMLWTFPIQPPTDWGLSIIC